MERVSWERRPKLRSPTLICSFKGWNDAAESASSALRFLATQWDAERIGAIDPEEFFDFQVTRPTVTLTEGLTREIEWPEFVVLERRASPGGAAGRRVPGRERAEPALEDLRGRPWSAAARELGVEQVVSLGALLADVPAHAAGPDHRHRRATASMAERLGFSQTRYEGPTGIVGVLHDACARAGLDSASLWAPVPHYVAAVPSPKASLALIQRVERLLGRDARARRARGGEHRVRAAPRRGGRGRAGGAARWSSASSSSWTSPRSRSATCPRATRSRASSSASCATRAPAARHSLMDQRLSLVTLGVGDLARARAFYEALGWSTGAAPGDDVVFFQAGGMIVALWDRARARRGQRRRPTAAAGAGSRSPTTRARPRRSTR